MAYSREHLWRVVKYADHFSYEHNWIDYEEYCESEAEARESARVIRKVCDARAIVEVEETDEPIYHYNTVLFG